MGDKVKLQRNYDGLRCGNYVVIKRDHKNSNGVWYFLCRCDCGREFYARCRDFSRKKSCGCMTSELISKGSIKHGGSFDRLYHVWDSMKQRCDNPKNRGYKNYGGRGISVCPGWYDYQTFREWSLSNGYDETAKRGECTLDRIDVNGNYEPSNCRWVNTVTQGNNRRDNITITHNGETHTVAEWARIIGMNKSTLKRRLLCGWSEEDALTIPIMPNWWSHKRMGVDYEKRNKGKQRRV